MILCASCSNVVAHIVFFVLMNDRKPTLLMFVQTFLCMCIFLILKNQKLHQLLSCLYLRFTCSSHFISMIYELWSNVHVNCTCYLLKLNTSKKQIDYLSIYLSIYLSLSLYIYMVPMTYPSPLFQKVVSLSPCPSFVAM